MSRSLRPKAALTIHMKRLEVALGIELLSNNCILLPLALGEPGNQPLSTLRSWQLPVATWVTMNGFCQHIFAGPDLDLNVRR